MISKREPKHMGEVMSDIAERYNKLTKTKMSKEEIKSLGWLHDDSEPNNYVKGSWDLYHNPNTNYIKIDDADGYPIVFEGVIKDISELNNIMDKHKI